MENPIDIGILALKKLSFDKIVNGKNNGINKTQFGFTYTPIPNNNPPINLANIDVWKAIEIKPNVAKNIPDTNPLEIEVSISYSIESKSITISGIAPTKESTLLYK